MNTAVGVLLLAIFAAWSLLLYAWADEREKRNSERIAVICHRLGIPLEDPPTRWQQLRAWWGERIRPVMAEAEIRTLEAEPNVAFELEPDAAPTAPDIPVQRPEQPSTEPMAAVIDRQHAELTSELIEDVDLAWAIAEMHDRMWNWKHDKETAA